MNYIHVTIICMELTSISHTSSWCDASLCTGITLPLTANRGMCNPWNFCVNFLYAPVSVRLLLCCGAISCVVIYRHHVQVHTSIMHQVPSLSPSLPNVTTMFLHALRFLVALPRCISQYSDWAMAWTTGA